MIKQIAAVLLLCAVLADYAYAGPIYKSVDKDGKVTYSSTAPSKNAKPAKLPEIMRADVKVIEQKLVTCDKHGGVNCQAGADSDGSVICYDGFKGSSARFRFTCNAPKLEITDVSDLTAAGAFTVFVRNSKSVEATKPVIVYKNDGGKEVKIAGPDKIAPFGVAEFQFTPSGTERPSQKPTLAQLDAACSNCP